MNTAFLGLAALLLASGRAPGVALATARFVLSGGEAADQTGWFTPIWVRTPAGWRAVRDHSSQFARTGEFLR